MVSAVAVAGTVIWCIPGIFGFLVWELKENWRSLRGQSAAEAVRRCRSVSHGETMGRLLQPGFHSGTLPKRFAKLRRRRTPRAGGRRAGHPVRKHVQALHRIELSIRRWIEREFLELFAREQLAGRPRGHARAVRLGTNCVRLAFGCPGLAEAGPCTSPSKPSGLARGRHHASPGWLDRLLLHQRRVLVTALVGLYKSAGVDLVREQIEDQFGSARALVRLFPAGLVVWPEAMKMWRCFTICTPTDRSPRNRFAARPAGCCQRSPADNSFLARFRQLGMTGSRSGIRT